MKLKKNKIKTQLFETMVTYL